VRLEPQHPDLGGDPVKDLVDPLDPFDLLGVVERVRRPDAPDGDGQVVGQPLVEVQPLLLGQHRHPLGEPHAPLASLTAP
jgi:hypothetical protein